MGTLTALHRRGDDDGAARRAALRAGALAAGRLRGALAAGRLAAVGALLLDGERGQGGRRRRRRGPAAGRRAVQQVRQSQTLGGRRRRAGDHDLQLVLGVHAVADDAGGRVRGGAGDDGHPLIAIPSENGK